MQLQVKHQPNLTQYLTIAKKATTADDKQQKKFGVYSQHQQQQQNKKPKKRKLEISSKSNDTGCKKGTINNNSNRGCGKKKSMIDISKQITTTSNDYTKTLTAATVTGATKKIGKLSTYKSQKATASSTTRSPYQYNGSGSGGMPIRTTTTTISRPNGGTTSKAFGSTVSPAIRGEKAATITPTPNLSLISRTPFKPPPPPRTILSTTAPAKKVSGGGGGQQQTFLKQKQQQQNQQRSQTNPVREANQNYFLTPAFQNQNFLKEECELAQAQVSPEHHKKKVERNNNNNTSGNNNNYYSLLNLRQSQLQRSNKLATATINDFVLPSLTPLNDYGFGSGGGIRRYSGGGIGNGITTSTSKMSNGMTTTTTTTTTKAISINKVPTTPPLSGIVSNIKSGITTSGGQQQQQSKILPHRTIPSTTVAAAKAAANPRVGGNNNNNFSGVAVASKPYNHNNNNTNVQAAMEEEDIKYIDSDDGGATATVAVTANGHSGGVSSLDRRSIGINGYQYSKGIPNGTGQNGISSASCSANAFKDGEVNTGSLNKGLERKARPKSTIICTPNNIVFEKINNYKSSPGTALPSEAATIVGAMTTTSKAIAAKRCGIDSGSIKASIEKFNSLSEKKQSTAATTSTPPPLVPISSGRSSAMGTVTQQRNRFSDDFVNCNGVATTTTATRMGDNKQQQRQHISDMATRVATSATTTSRLYNSYTNSLPLKISAASAQHTATVASTSAKSSSLERQPYGTATPLISETTKATTANLSSLSNGFNGVETTTASTMIGDVTIKNSATTSAAVASTNLLLTDSSVRSTAIRSTLPPASPTATRYWDRDSVRTSTLSSTASSSYNNLDDANPKASTSSNDEEAGLCGLRNIGNTCFMNSVIQCLSHTSELTKFLRSHTSTRSSSTKDQQILNEFAKLIREMWSGSTRSVTPMDLKRAFSSKHRMYSDYNQQDAQEFLRFFLDSLHCALNSGTKGEPLKIDDNLSDNKKADLTWEWYIRHENSLIRDLFVGQLKSTLRCTTCGNASVTFDPFWDLSVPLPSSTRCKLDACLDLFIREEVLDGDEMPTCSKCKARRKCTKSFTIQRFPKYLVIHLKRFSETRWSKLSNIVEFPTGERELNMGPYGSNPSANMYYSLYGISNHMGSTAGGHYVALCKHPNTRKWHEFNDNIVSESLSENHLVSSSAYILFYERA